MVQEMWCSAGNEVGYRECSVLQGMRCSAENEVG